MTKEELRREAIQYAVDYPTSYGNGYKHKDLRIAYLAGAEPREKRIAELEKKLKAEKEYNETLRKEVDEYTNSHTLCAKYKELEKENEELKELNNELLEEGRLLKEQIAALQAENAELKEKNKWYSEQICYKECAEVWRNLTKATDIIKKLKALYFSPVVTKEDVKQQDEILVEAEQFLKSKVEK